MAKSKAKPTNSFENLVAKNSMRNFMPIIQQEVAGQIQPHIESLREQVQGLYFRMIALEKVLLENVDGISLETIANKVAEVEDQAYGLVSVNRPIQEGDSVRLTLAAKLVDQEDFQAPSKYIIHNIGSGQTVGLELETKILGMEVNQPQIVEIGEGEKKAQVKLQIDRISAPQGDAQ